MTALRTVVCTLLVAALIPDGASAQKGETKYGVLGGFTSATLSGNDVANADAKLGATFGGYVSFGFSPNFSIETGALYAQRGAKSSSGGVTEKLKLGYVEVPLLISAKFPGQGTLTPFISAGPAIAIKASCGISASGGGANVGTGCSDLESELDAKIKSIDPGLVGAAGVDFNSFRVSVRYFAGLSTIDKVAPAYDIKNRAVSLLVGYSF